MITQGIAGSQPHVRAQALLFVEELASIVLTPFVLYWSLPACVPSILAFVRDFTLQVEGVGDICSLAAFDFARHGNTKYGAPTHAPKVCPLHALLPPLASRMHALCCFLRPDGLR